MSEKAGEVLVRPKQEHEGFNHKSVYKWRQTRGFSPNCLNNANQLREGRPERPGYDSETRTVIMGYFEFCQTATELSIEHQRTVERIADTIEYAELNYPKVVEFYKNRKKLHRRNR